MDEATIINRLRQGDPDVMGHVVERYHSRLFPVAYGICKNHEDVEEVLQDVYMLAMTKIDAFEERSRLFTWLYRITVNTALMKRRQNQRKSFAVSLESEEILSGWNDTYVGTDMDFPDWSQEEMVSAQQLQERIAGELKELPRKYQDVLALRAQGYSIKETSRALRTTPAAVKSRMHRGRLNLKGMLSGVLSEN